MLTLNNVISITPPQFLLDEVSAIDVVKSFEQRFYLSYPKQFQTMLRQYIENTIDARIIISEGWMNCVRYNGIDNSFDWHNEDGVGSNDGQNEGKYVCIMWLAGETNMGGSFKYIDDNGDIVVVGLNPPQLILIARETLHCVDTYLGKALRISFNFNFDIE
jgi:hypothetical protein